MIISLYVLLLAIAGILVMVGYSAKGKADAFLYIGYAFVFLLGVLIMPNTPGSLEYQTGEVRVVDGNQTTITYTYAEFEDLTYGFYIAIAGALGMLITFFLTKSTDYGEAYND